MPKQCYAGPASLSNTYLAQVLRVEKFGKKQPDTQEQVSPDICPVQTETEEVVNSTHLFFLQMFNPPPSSSGSDSQRLYNQKLLLAKTTVSLKPEERRGQSSSRYRGGSQCEKGRQRVNRRETHTQTHTHREGGRERE